MNTKPLYGLKKWDLGHFSISEEKDEKRYELYAEDVIKSFIPKNSLNRGLTQ